MDLGLSGKKAIVTGGSRGIGRSIAELLLEEGAAVAICARGEEGVRAAEAELASLGTVYAATADMADGDAVEKFVGDATEALGGLDIIVHNTSAMGGAQGLEGWTNMFNIDVMAGVRAVNAAMPLLEASDAASVVFIGTTASIEAFGGAGPCGPLKAAMRAHTNDLGQTLAPNGISRQRRFAGLDLLRRRRLAARRGAGAGPVRVGAEHDPAGPLRRPRRGCAGRRLRRQPGRQLGHRHQHRGGRRPAQERGLTSARREAHRPRYQS